MAKRRNPDLPDDELVAIVIHKLTHDFTFRELQNQYGVSCVTISNLYKPALASIVDTMKDNEYGKVIINYYMIKLIKLIE